MVAAHFVEHLRQRHAVDDEAVLHPGFRRRHVDGMGRAGAVHIDARELDATATTMVVVATYWLSYEYVRDPRRALEPEHAQLALLRGAHHTLSLLLPYLEASQREHLHTLVGNYT